MNLREMASVYLTDADILAALLHTGPASRARTLARAQALLATCGSLRGVMEADSRALGRRTHARLHSASVGRAGCQLPVVEMAQIHRRCVGYLTHHLTFPDKPPCHFHFRLPDAVMQRG